MILTKNASYALHVMDIHDKVIIFY